MGFERASAHRTEPGRNLPPVDRIGSARGNGSRGCRGNESMRNVWIICRKELRSYFVSPVAYILLVMFAVIFGFFFWNSVGYFVNMSMEATLEGEQFPMNLNEQVIRPLLSNVNVIGLFFIPLITMRLFAEEKRSGTIELIATSPITDSEVIIGKWLSALIMYSLMLLATVLDIIFLFRYGNPDWNLHFNPDAESDHCRSRNFRSLPDALGPGLGQPIRKCHLGSGAVLHVRDHAFRFVRQGVARYKRRHL